MAISPKPMDYMSVVRGVLNDLREDAKQQQQLALSAAQLSQQRANAQRQFALEQQRMDIQALNDQRALEADAYTKQRQAFSDSLAQRRLELEENQQIESFRQKRLADEQDKTSSALQNKFQLALEKNDMEQVSSVLQEIGEANLTAAQRAAIQDNGFAAIQRKRQFEQIQKDLDTAPVGLELAAQLNRIDPKDYTPDQYAAQISDYEKKFRDLGNKDQRVIDRFFDAQKLAVEKGSKFRETALGSMRDSFISLGEQGRLDPEFQKKYNELKAKPEAFTSLAIQGLAFARNKQDSINQLKAIDSRLARTAENLIRQNPGLAIVKTDPVTGESYRTFTYEPPDLSPVEGFSATIDPETGTVTKAAIDRATKWEAEVTSPTFLTGQVPLMRSFEQRQVQPSGPAKETVGLPFRATPSRFESVAAGPAVVLPVPPAQPPAIAPERIQEIVTVYNQNPDAVYRGRPIREIVALLQRQQVDLPGLRVKSIAEPGQNR